MTEGLGPLLANHLGGRMRAVYLQGSEDAPPYAALEIIGRGYRGLVVQKPSRNDIPAQNLIFNGDGILPANNWGWGSLNYPVLAYYDNALQLTNRERIGTVAGSWRLSKGYEGMVGIGQVESGAEYAVVMPWIYCRGPGSGNPYYYNGGMGPVNCICCGCSRFHENRGGTEGTGFPQTLNATLTMPCIGTNTVTLSGGGSCAVNPSPISAFYYYTGTVGGSLFDPTVANPCDGGLPTTGVGWTNTITVALWCIRCSNEPVNHCNGSGKWMALVRWRSAKFNGAAYDLQSVYALMQMPLLSCRPLSFSSTATPAKCLITNPFTGSCQGVDFNAGPTNGLQDWIDYICTNNTNVCIGTDYLGCVNGTLQVDIDE